MIVSSNFRVNNTIQNYKLEKMDLTSKQRAKIKESLSNDSTLNFIKLAGEWKIAEEASFVVAIAELPAGAELLKYFNALEVLVFYSLIH
jgi:hypothetical protein